MWRLACSRQVRSAVLGAMTGLLFHQVVTGAELSSTCSQTSNAKFSPIYPAIQSFVVDVAKGHKIVIGALSRLCTALWDGYRESAYVGILTWVHNRTQCISGATPMPSFESVGPYFYGCVNANIDRWGFAKISVVKRERNPSPRGVMGISDPFHEFASIGSVWFLSGWRGQLQVKPDEWPFLFNKILGGFHICFFGGFCGAT